MDPERDILLVDVAGGRLSRGPQESGEIEGRKTPPPLVPVENDQIRSLCGLFDAEVVRDAPWVALNAARRKAETLRFARRAAGRLLGIEDPFLNSDWG